MTLTEFLKMFHADINSIWGIDSQSACLEAVKRNIDALQFVDARIFTPAQPEKVSVMYESEKTMCGALPC